MRSGRPAATERLEQGKMAEIRLPFEGRHWPKTPGDAPDCACDFLSKEIKA